VKFESQFNIGDQVRVVRDRGFIGTVEAVHAEAKQNEEPYVWYTVSIPLDMQGTGRNHVERWGYRETWLESV
jgi:hypothetical protein